MNILAIDPGPDSSGVVLFDVASMSVVWSNAEMPNDEVLEKVRYASGYDGHSVACECIEAMYAHVGKETVRTIRFTGRIEEAVLCGISTLHLLSPQDIKKVVCGTASAKDPAVRQAVIDTLGKPGTKKNPGPTYGVSSHAWRALAVALAASQNLKPTQP